MKLWECINYKSGIQFLIDVPITEYDISKANINVLRDANAISEEEYQYFYQAPKEERSIAIGKLQGRDPKITEILKNGIANARKVFLEINRIDDSRVLEIRNDAIVVIGNPVDRLDITERVKFRDANHYTSFYSINAIEYFYFFDIVTQRENLDAKGLGDGATSLHLYYMLEFLSELFYSAQIEGVKTAIYLLQLFHTNYIKKILDINYYRELNSASRFRLNKGFSMTNTIYADNLTEYDKRYIDISFNESILRYLNRIYASIYFGTK